MTVATEVTGGIEAVSAAIRGVVTEAALAGLPPVLADLLPEWADRHQASVGAVLVDLPPVLAVEASVVLPADLAVVLEDLLVVLAVETARAGSAR